MTARTDDGPMAPTHLRIDLHAVYDKSAEAATRAADALRAVAELRSDLASLRENRAANGVTDANVSSLLTDHEERIRANERFRWALPASAIASVASAASAIVAALIATGAL